MKLWRALVSLNKADYWTLSSEGGTVGGGWLTIEYIEWWPSGIRNRPFQDFLMEISIPEEPNITVKSKDLSKTMGVNTNVSFNLEPVCQSSILGLQPSKTRSFPIKTGVESFGFQEVVFSCRLLLEIVQWGLHYFYFYFFAVEWIDYLYQGKRIRILAGFSELQGV